MLPPLIKFYYFGHVQT